MSLKDDKRFVLTNLAKQNISIEEALRAIEYLEQKQFEELGVAAARVVEEFDVWGEVLQTDEDGNYSPSTAIESLRAGLKIANNL